MIEVEEAGFSYGARVVFAGANLTLPAGSFTLVLGPSGVGKTTLVRLCWRDLVPDRGAVRFWGKVPAAGDRDATAALRRRIGVVPQDAPFLDHLPVLENVALPLRAAGVDVSGRKADLRALLDWTGIGGRADDAPAALSAVERRRAALARAVILGPEVVLVDDPAGGAEREAGLAILGLLVELNRMGTTTLVATHDEEIAEAAHAAAGARVLRLGDGRLTAEAAA